MSCSTEDFEIPIFVATSETVQPAASGHTILLTVAFPCSDSRVQSIPLGIVERDEGEPWPFVDAAAAKPPDGAASLGAEKVDVTAPE
jgi:hypothetical protein